MIKQKQKKITIKPFLNKKIDKECSDSDGNPFYPMYILVTYDRKNTHIRSEYGMYYEDINEPEIIPVKEFETKILYKVVDFETKGGEKSYDLTGLKERYKVFSMPVKRVLDEYLKTKLKKALMKTNDELQFVLRYEGFKCNFRNVYKAASLLFKNLSDYLSMDFKKEIKAYELLDKIQPDTFSSFSFATLIEWKDDSFKSEYEAKLLKMLKDKKEVTELMKITERIVDERLKNIVKTG